MNLAGKKNEQHSFHNPHHSTFPRHCITLIRFHPACHWSSFVDGGGGGHRSGVALAGSGGGVARVHAGVCERRPVQRSGGGGDCRRGVVGCRRGSPPGLALAVAVSGGYVLLPPALPDLGLGGLVMVGLHAGDRCCDLEVGLPFSSLMVLLCCSSGGAACVCWGHRGGASGFAGLFRYWRCGSEGMRAAGMVECVQQACCYIGRKPSWALLSVAKWWRHACGVVLLAEGTIARHYVLLARGALG